MSVVTAAVLGALYLWGTRSGRLRAEGLVALALYSGASICLLLAALG